MARRGMQGSARRFRYILRHGAPLRHFRRVRLHEPVVVGPILAPQQARDRFQGIRKLRGILVPVRWILLDGLKDRQ